MVSYYDDAVPLIPQFYAGRSIFITGATGFVGKVLVERLLSTCPDIDRLFLLIREKRDCLAEKRLQQLKESQVFANVREFCPSQLDKLSVVCGDITLPGLGLGADEVELLKNVSVVFHSAATLKFHEALPMAVQQNVRSVISVLELCDSLPNMQALVYVSTAYSNSDLSVVEERVYPAPASLASLLALTDAVSEDVLQPITDKYISPKPNTYTFTKAMAEVAVQKHGAVSYPIAIFRPSIVISALRDPFPGWVENLNGPTGIVAAAGKGLLHVFRCKKNARADMIPVDIVIDTLIAVGWETATDQSSDIRVYNCSSYGNPTSWGAFEDALRQVSRREPFDNVMWWPCGVSVETELSLITVSHRLHAMYDVLNFFGQKEWHFVTTNVDKLRQRLTKQDAEIYNLDPKSFTWDDMYEKFIKGTKKYILKEKEENMEQAKRHLRKMFYLHHGLVIFILALVIRLSLRNSYIHDFVLGIVRLFVSIYHTVCSAVPPVM